MKRRDIIIGMKEGIKDQKELWETQHIDRKEESQEIENIQMYLHSGVSSYCQKMGLWLK